MLILSAFFFHFTSFSQVKVANGNFEYPDKDVTINPEKPKFCSASGTGITLTCIEDFESYKWELLNPIDLVQEIQHGKTITVQRGGRWRLTVPPNKGKFKCQTEVFVYDLSDDSHIRKFFEEEGFYCIPIFRGEVQLHENENEGNRTEECKISGISFKEGGPYDDFVEESVDYFMANFPPIKDDSPAKIVSEKNCLCNPEKGLDKLLDEFNNQETSLWLHSYFGGSSTDGCLYVKGKMPGDPVLPIASQKEHFEDTKLLDRIYKANKENSDKLYAIAANTFLPHPIEGYFNESLCNGILEETNTYLSSAGLAVKASGNITGYFASENNQEGVNKGSLVWLNKQTTNQSYIKFQGFRFKDNQFSGYGNEETGLIFEEFFDPINNLEELNYKYHNCESNCALTAIVEALYSEFKPDGGLNFVIGTLDPEKKDKLGINFFPPSLKNTKTICFVTPTRTILAFPNDGLGCLDLSYVEFTYGSFSNEEIFEKYFVPGLLYKFEYKGVVYTYSTASNSYISKTNLSYNSVEIDANDGIIYGLAVGKQYGVYKIGKGNLIKHVNGATIENYYYNNFLDFAEVFKPFDSNSGFQ